MRIAIGIEAPKVFDHTKEDEQTSPTFNETQQTVLSDGSTTNNVQGPEDGSGLRGKGSTTSSDTSDSQDHKEPADSHEEFMRTHEHMSVDDFDEDLMDEY